MISYLLIQCGYVTSDTVGIDITSLSYDNNINKLNHLSLYEPSSKRLDGITEYWFNRSVDEQIFHQSQREIDITLPSSKNNDHKLKAALVLLIRKESVFSSLRRLQKTTLKTCKFLLKYPVYILTNHLQELNKSEITKINEFINNADHDNIEIINIDKYWDISKHYALSSDFMPDPESYEMYHGINYRIMCYFHTSVIFDIPQISSLDYYMRLDDDSELVCSNGNVLFNRQYTLQMINNKSDYMSSSSLLVNDKNHKINKTDYKFVDVFEYMFNNQYIYSYWKTEADPYDWTRNFIPFIMSYKKRHNLKFNLDVPYYMKQWDKNGLLTSSLDKQHAPMFFNNWEINYVPYFKSKSVRDFNKAVILSNGHFLYRWGDAPIRYFQIAFFVNESKLLCLQNSMWRKFFSYYHKKDFHFRSNCDITFDLGVDKDFINRVDTKKKKKGILG